MIYARLALLFVTALGYGLTVSRQVSLWDCGEFVAGIHVLGIPHPPGTPFFMVLGRAFEVLTAPTGLGAAFRLSLLSAMASVAACLFVFEITAMVLKRGGYATRIVAAASFLAGSLLAFSDTFWFNAVEAEVYGLSMANLALGVWLILKWDEAPPGRRDRWLVLFAFQAFLGTGLHTYSLLSLPVVAAFIGFRTGRWVPGKVTRAGLVAAAVSILFFLWKPYLWGADAAMVVLALVIVGLLVAGFRNGELRDIWFWALWVLLGSAIALTLPFLVGWGVGIAVSAVAVVLLSRSVANKVLAVILGLGASALLFLHLPLGEEWKSLPVLAMVAVALVAGVPLLFRRGEGRGGAAMLVFSMLLAAGIGYSIQLYLPVRSSTEPVMDENNPRDWESMRNALERKQYGSQGMVERAFYRRASGLSQLGFSPNIGYLGYHLNQYLPAPMGSQTNANLMDALKKPIAFLQVGHRVLFELLLLVVLWFAWTRKQEAGVSLISVLFLLSSMGLLFYVNFADGTRPDSSSAARWYRTLDEVAVRAREAGVALPEAPPLNELVEKIQRLQGMESGEVQSFIRNDPALQGWLSYTEAARKAGMRVPPPPGSVHREVRERDYFYTPAFLFFAVLLGWVAASGLGRLNESRQRWGVVACGMAWIIPFASHYEAHDRSGDHVARDFAYNLLTSVPQGGILFTAGDNDTFPLWYLQMVEGIRTDVAVVNLSLAYSRWYQESVLREHPNLKLAFSLDSLWSIAYQTLPSWTDSLAPDVALQGGTPGGRWRPSAGELFTWNLAKGNWGAASVCFVFNSGPESMLGMEAKAPVAGLTRIVGMDQLVADALLRLKAARQFRYTNLETGSWTFQDGARHVVGSYRWMLRATGDAGKRMNRAGMPEDGLDPELDSLTAMFAPQGVTKHLPVHLRNSKIR